jgi:tetratricopeptide (TPR) repeat protein
VKRVVFLAVTVMLAGCAGENIKERSPRAQQVINLGRQGQAAYLKGDLPRAALLFKQALADAMHIEDSEGVAVMSINLARVSRDSGNSASALKLLDAVSPWHRSNLSARAAQELDLLAAVLLSDLDRRDEALTRLQMLRDKCQARCELAIGMDSLQARLTLEKGEPGSSAQLATAAIARFRDHGNQLELANLFRVQGEARLALGDFEAARQSLESALGIDKSLSQPAKIAQDLEALARSALAAKDTAAHAGYMARLEEVRRARIGHTFQ